jgi:hypothetical protein
MLSKIFKPRNKFSKSIKELEKDDDISKELIKRKEQKLKLQLEMEQTRIELKKLAQQLQIMRS